MFLRQILGFSLIEKSVALIHYTNIIWNKKALSHEDGRAKLFYDKEYSSSSSMSESNIHAFYGEFSEIETVALDSYLKAQ